MSIQQNINFESYIPKDKFKGSKILNKKRLNIQINKIKEDIKCIEINPRFGGGYPMSHKAGGNFPELIIKEYFEGNELEFTEDWQKDLLMLRYDSTF